MGYGVFSRCDSQLRFVSFNNGYLLFKISFCFGFRYLRLIDHTCQSFTGLCALGTVFWCVDKLGGCVLFFTYANTCVLCFTGISGFLRAYCWAISHGEFGSKRPSRVPWVK